MIEGRPKGFRSTFAKRAAAWFSLGAAAVLCGWFALAQGVPDQEYQTKAKFIGCFALETRWPDEPFADKTAPFVVGVFGPDGTVAAFRLLEGAQIKDRKVVVKQCHEPEEAAQCRVVFFSAAEEAKIEKVLDQLKTASVLTVGETDVFKNKGGIITFVIGESAGLAYAINRPAAARAKLTLDSQLLKRAKK